MNTVTVFSIPWGEPYGCGKGTIDTAGSSIGANLNLFSMEIRKRIHRSYGHARRQKESGITWDIF